MRGDLSESPSCSPRQWIRPGQHAAGASIQRRSHRAQDDVRCRRTAGFLEALPDRPDFIVSGCEAHVCVLQTVLGLLSAGRRVYVVRDALGSRRSESKETAIRRMERNGAEVVTTEMVVFEVATGPLMTRASVVYSLSSSDEPAQWRALLLRTARG